MCDSWIVVSYFVVGFVSESRKCRHTRCGHDPRLPFLTDRRKIQEKWLCGGGDGK
jgi:hypothetical protein